MMVNSSTDMMGLVCELHNRRIAMTLGKIAKRQAKPLNVYLDSLPSHIQHAIKVVARLNRRYARGDYRHEPTELGIVQTLCNYLIEAHATATGGTPKFKEFSPADMETKLQLGANTYLEIAGAIREQIG